MNFCRGDTPFCSEECRQEQIEIDKAKEESWNLSLFFSAFPAKSVVFPFLPVDNSTHLEIHNILFLSIFKHLIKSLNIFIFTGFYKAIIALAFTLSIPRLGKKHNYQ
ncbi:hypothetical protein Droror1_Dr00002737 [Drosera rotundifolia]